MDSDKKTMLIFGIATVAIIGIGAFLFSKNSTSTPQPEKAVNQDILVKSDSNKMQAPAEKAVLVEFGDFQCPACGSYFPLVKKLSEDYKDNLSIVFRNFPLPQHKNALPAAYAAEAAGKQGKYWEMFDLLYDGQDKWSEASNAVSIFEDYAITLDLDLDKFKKDAASDEVKKKVNADYADGNSLGVNSTPTFYLNASKIPNPRSYDEFKTQVEAAFLNSTVDVTGEEAYHAHFDLSVVLDGTPIDFTQDKYQSSEENELDEAIHMHDGNGKVVHLHKKGATLEQFFNSLKIKFTKECLNLDTGANYCNGTSKTLKMFVSGQENTDFEKYVPQDLDRILITYGAQTESQIKSQIDGVSDDACIYSEKCPERGTPPDEKCVGGLGTGCEE